MLNLSQLLSNSLLSVGGAGCKIKLQFTTKIFIQVLKFTLLAYINNCDKKFVLVLISYIIACFTQTCFFP